ncbi:MAG: hypothetical protein V4627_19500 [Pseudomonadota bacterium]
MKFLRSMPVPGLALAMVFNMAVANAQEATRDPTVAPGESGATSPSPVGTEGMTVLVRDDKPYLMVGARLYAPGDKLGNLRVERITEKEVWFHDGLSLIKAPRFAGIERKSVANKPSCAAPAKLSPPPVAPCEDTQP